MTATLIVTAFGRLEPNPKLLGEDAEEDLYSVFLARSELMGWCRYVSSAYPSLPLLWEVNKADLSNDGSQIGYVQVGLAVHPGSSEGGDVPALDDGSALAADRSVRESAAYSMPHASLPADPQLAIPPLLQCVDDSLRWFGEADVTAYQVTAINVDASHRDHILDLAGMINWFNTKPAEPVHAVLTLATDRRDAPFATEVIKPILQVHADSLRLGPLVSAPAAHAEGDQGKSIRWANADTAIAVSLPAWSADAIGWVVAMVFDAALSKVRAPEHLSVRLTRTRT